MKLARAVEVALALLLAWWLRRPLWEGFLASGRLLWRLVGVVAAVTWWWLRLMLRMAGLALAAPLGMRP
jgi:hypothetical protein